MYEYRGLAQYGGIIVVDWELKSPTARRICNLKNNNSSPLVTLRFDQRPGFKPRLVPLNFSKYTKLHLNYHQVQENILRNPETSDLYLRSNSVV